MTSGMPDESLMQMQEIYKIRDRHNSSNNIRLDPFSGYSSGYGGGFGGGGTNSRQANDLSMDFAHTDDMSMDAHRTGPQIINVAAANDKQRTKSTKEMLPGYLQRLVGRGGD